MKIALFVEMVSFFLLVDFGALRLLKISHWDLLGQLLGVQIVLLLFRRDP